MTILIPILSVTIIALVFIFGGKKLKLKVKGKAGKKSYTAEKKGFFKGNAFLDWFYYDQDGKSIEDENLKKIIFEAFSDEDWYGAYEFYTKSETSKSKEVEVV